jgi:hypothetical protein
MDLRWLQARRTGVCDSGAPTYERPMLTAAARPHVFWVGEDQERVRSWPIGSALLETLGDINGDVQEALADERARLSEHGYPADLPLPARWWNPEPRPEHVPEELLLAVADA